MRSQSPIQRGWLCGLGLLVATAVWPRRSQSPIQRGWLCGALAREVFLAPRRKSQSPIQRGWLCGAQGAGWPAGKAAGLNPLSSGDGFVARPCPRQTPWTIRAVSQSPIQRGWLCGDGWDLVFAQARQVVSIPYPAGMALWPTGWAGWKARPTGFSIPYPAGMALWRHLPWGGVQGGFVSIPYPAGMALWPGALWPCSWPRPRPVSIPYPAGMALWPPHRHRARRRVVSQSPIQRGWLCGVKKPAPVAKKAA